ncbi:4630_t:CDS:2, partial [Racocetra persica]
EAARCFFDEIIQVEVKTKKGPALFSKDEHSRTQTTIQTLSKQPSIFVKDTGIVIVGNASESTIIGIGPVPAIKEALKRVNLKLSDIGLVEINEVFAPQYLSVKKELGLDRNITNTNGDLSNLFTS